MRLEPKTQKELDALIAAQKIVLPIEQSTLWQEFDAKVTGRKPLGVFAVVDNDNTVVAIAGLTLYSQKKYDWVWIKHGPYFIDQSPSSSVVASVLDAIKEHVLKNAPTAIFMRVTIPAVNYNLKPPLHNTMYDRTIIIDLDQTDEQILASMTRSGRYDVRKSLKAEINFTKIEPKEALKNFDDYYAILAETAGRDGFRANDKQVYINMLEGLGGNVHLFAAIYKNKPIAWAIVTEYAGKGVYYYAASNEQARDLCAAYGLQYYVMRTLRDNGCKSYDMMGIASDAHQNLISVTGFKKKFSHEFTDINKTYDIPLKPRKYATIKLAKKVRSVVS